MTKSKFPPGFAPISTGWFLDERNPEYESTYEADVGDSLAADPDVFYGPAKWDGLYGPSSARRLLRIRMANYDEWASAVEAMAYDNGPDPGAASPWPGVVEVTEYGKRVGLGSLNGLTVANKDELLKLIHPIAASLPKHATMQVSPAGRLASSVMRFPFLAD